MLIGVCVEIRLNTVNISDSGHSDSNKQHNAPFCKNKKICSCVDALIM